jgi:3-dehydroquinate synthase
LVATSSTIRLSTPLSGYDIHIGSGLLASLYPQLRAVMHGRPFRSFLITSPSIWDLWSANVLASFPAEQTPIVLFLPAGEEHKRMRAVESLCEQMAQAGADRDSLLLAFGGGVIGDLAGFVAAIFMRGIPFVQIPSTLLAQVDSSIGGKTGVNLAAGKNLVGSFHQPLAVIADIELLRTLPERELMAGLQESVKAAIIRDPSLFSYLEANKLLIISRDASVLARIIAESVQIKADVVQEDERESGIRMILNFGHTLGHAIEAATNFKQLLHGEAVAWGSIAALHLGRMRGTITPEQFARMTALIHAFGPLPGFIARSAQLVALTAADKKTRNGRRAFVLPTGIGSVEIVYDVSDGELSRAAEAMLAEVPQ